MMQVDDTACLKHVVTAEDVAAYAQLTGRADPPPEDVPPPLISALFSQLLGVNLPGPGTNYLKQETVWRSPARQRETLTARVTITRLRPEKHLVDLQTECFGEDGRLVCDGRALVYVEDVGRA